MTYALGVDIGGTKGAVLLLAPDSWQVLARRQFPAPPRCADYLAAIDQHLHALRAAHGVATSPPTAIGIACGGPLDSRAGIVQRPPHLPDWDDTPVAAWLSARHGAPAYLQNDADAGALAEWYWGTGQGVQNLAFITFGTGFGAGLITGGRLIEGRAGMAGEIGHLRLTDDGPEGYGKRGSVEGWCSGAGIAARVRAAVAAQPAAAGALLAAVAGDAARLSPAELFATARAGDPLALTLVQETGRRVGQALALLVDLLNPERLILGSLYVRGHDLLRTPILAGLHAEALPANAAGVDLVPAALGEAIGDYATMAIVRAALSGARGGCK